MAKKSKKKTLGQEKEATQKVVNRYIRERDKGKPCISCGCTDKPLQAGHLWPVSTYDSIRFDVDNIHGQCSWCNCWQHGNQANYLLNLPDRIGQKRTDELIEKAKQSRTSGYKYSRDELSQIKGEFMQKIREL